MSQFDYLVRKHTKALGLFAKITAKLRRLEAKIQAVMARSQTTIEEASKAIEQEKSNLAFLNEQLVKTQTSREQVEKLTGV